MKNNIKTLTVACLLCLLFVGSLWFYQTGNISVRPNVSQAEDNLNLKAQLLAEMEAEIQERVKEEVSAQLAELEKNQDEQLKKILTKIIATHQDEIARLKLPDESKQDAIRRVVREITTINNIHQAKRMTDEELDATIGSALNLQTYLPNGYQKAQREYMQLAQAQTQQLPAQRKQAKPQKTTQQPAGTQQEQRREKPKSVQRAVQQRGGILLPRGKGQIEPSFTYASFSSNVINVQGFSILPVLVIGQISTDSIKRDVFIPALSMKYGLWHNLQVEASIPYRYEFDRQNNESISEEVTDYDGWGDLSVGVSRQIFWEKGWLPDTVASLSLKTRTGQEPYNNEIGIGTGHYAIRGGLVFVKSSDPAVVFGNISYTYNHERDNIPNFGSVNPGNSIGYSLGTAIALSYQTAINFAYEQSVTFKQSVRGATVPGSFLNSASFKSGFTWAFSANTSVDFNVGIGLTSDSPDISLTLRVPHTF